jgi:alkylation response protein AidB-like acyl-CoA dehydrogenase
MHFDFTDEQKMFRDASRKFLEAECPATFVRSLMEDENAHDPAFWKKQVDMGWTGMLVPEAYGGVGGTLTDMIVVAEEMGRAVMPGPFYGTSVTGVTLLSLLGSEDQKQPILTSVAAGDRLLSPAVLESGGCMNCESIHTFAEHRQGKYILNGEKLFVPDANVSHTLLVAARTTRGAGPDRGVSLFLVETGAPGVAVEQMPGVDRSRRVCRVTLDNVTIGEEGLLGKRDEAWPALVRAMEMTHVPQCCELVGLAEKTLEMVTEYLKIRVQFNKPIGVFQALQHRCADIMVHNELAKSLAYYACYSVETNKPDAAVALAMAQAYCSETAKHTVSDGIQLFGGIGFTWEHDIHLYQRRVLSLSFNMGTLEEQRERVARAFLD